MQFFLHPSGKIPDWHDAVEKAIFGFNQADEDALASLSQGRRLLDETASSETVNPTSVPLYTTRSALLCPNLGCAPYRHLQCPVVSSVGCAPYYHPQCPVVSNLGGALRITPLPPAAPCCV